MNNGPARHSRHRLSSLLPALLVMVLLSLGAKVVHAADGSKEVPGFVICHQPASSRQYLGSPSLAMLPDRTLLVSHDFFGPGSTHDVSRIFASTNNGVSWQHRSTVKGAFWSSLFYHNGSTYLLGPNRQDGSIVIRRSGDGGRTWTSPESDRTGQLLSDGLYHCAPVPVVVHRGRLWRAFEQVTPNQRWGERFQSFVMSAPVDADLLDSRSWQGSRRLARDAAWLGGRFGGWLEGNVVVAPDDSIVNLLRVDFRSADEKAAMVRIDAGGKDSRFDPATGFIDFPGGCKKFQIRRDPLETRYWALCNFVPRNFRGGNPERTRNTLALATSVDLIHWETRAILLHHPDTQRHGFQYPDWLFDGNDILAAVRTAHDDSSGGAHNQHDANYITFHRFANFRALKTSLDP